MIIAADQLAGLILRKSEAMAKRQKDIVLGGVEDYPKYQRALGYLEAVGELDDYITRVVRTNGAIPEE